MRKKRNRSFAITLERPSQSSSTHRWMWQSDCNAGIDDAVAMAKDQPREDVEVGKATRSSKLSADIMDNITQA